MSDIFISYSSKDREQAQMLMEMLASAGLSVWIDRHGIDAATSWSGEIVDAIEQCRAFVVMLSPNSIASYNVIKEVALAAEQKKKILPLDLEPVELPRDLKYHLAGIQRASMTNIDGIMRALNKLGLVATTTPQPPPISLRSQEGEIDKRKSLMILPFEDLSPTGDNGWFADGIVSEMINALSNVKSLRLMDAATTKEYKSFKGQLSTYAREMSIRYFVQGDVRKFGDNIKISARLLDIETGDHLWQDAIKATMVDIFDIQETVANKVVEALKIHLTSDEKQKLGERGTESAEAYELFLKANEYFDRQTKQGFQLAAQLLGEAIQLDAGYANAYRFKANALSDLYRNYDRNPELLTEAEHLCMEALRIQPHLYKAYYPLSQVYLHQGKVQEAEATAHELIHKAPDKFLSHFALGFIYSETGQPAKAISVFEDAVRLKPDDRALLFNLVTNCAYADEMERCKEWALRSLPVEERHLRLHPDDDNSRMQYGVMLFFSGHLEDARREALRLKQAKDSNTLFNTSCLFCQLDDKQDGLETLRRAIEAGFQNIPAMKDLLIGDTAYFASLSGTPGYEEVRRMVEELSNDR